MTTLLVEHRVADYDAWRDVYDSVEPLRQAAGVTSHSVWRVPDDPNAVVITHDFDDAASAQAFVGSEDLREAMGRAGVDPASVQVRFLDRA